MAARVSSPAQLPHISLVPVVNASRKSGHLLILSEKQLGFPEDQDRHLLDRANITYKHTSSGWMDTSTFDEWFAKVFVKLVKETRDQEFVGTKNPLAKSARHLLLFDGHTSHYSHKTIDLALKNNIDLMVTPSHMTHRLQPLDVGVFQHLKPALESALKHITSMSSYREALRNGDLVKMIAKTYIQHVTLRVITSGFRDSGIYLWCPEEGLKSIPGWGESFC